MPPITPPDASPALTTVFSVLALLVALSCVALLSRARAAAESADASPGPSTPVAAVAVAVWMAAWWALASSGRLARFDVLPPPVMFVMLSVLAVGVGLSVGRVGRVLAAGLPTVTLIGVQAFRLPLELTMHRAASEGVMPAQMSFQGWNFDIVTGVLAVLIVLAYRGREVPRPIALAFGVVGMALLLTILGIAIASTPLVHAFGEEPSRLNTWIFFAPFVWLPTVFVLTAITFQLVLFRRLFASR